MFTVQLRELYSTVFAVEFTQMQAEVMKLMFYLGPLNFTYSIHAKVTRIIYICIFDVEPISATFTNL